ncbi:tyrosine-type recombinase/integrase, partial [Paracoccus fontiphilus]
LMRVQNGPSRLQEAEGERRRAYDVNTGMSRQDLCRVGWQHVSKTVGGTRIAYKRAKTSVAADLPILPDLAEELAHAPTDRLLFITQDARPIGYKPETLGNWFRDRCAEAQVPGSPHGLRKAGATRLADAGASAWEIASYLAHEDTKQADTYAKKANRSKLADSGFTRLQTVPKFSAELDKKRAKGER